MTKKKKIAKIVAAVCAVVIFAAGIGTSLYMNVNTNKKLTKAEALSAEIKKENKKLKEEIASAEVNDDDYDEEDWDEDWDEEDFGEVTYEEGDYYHENGELIEIGEYKIRDFDYIAQAYLTGDHSAVTTRADKETLELATAVIEEIITDDMTMYEKELAIHDWLCENISFDYTSLEAIVNSHNFADTPYGLLKYKTGVCVGYATTFRLLTTMAGMECDIIHDSEYTHTWNIIKLDDGEYYLVDVYSDASDEEASHAYFNVNEEFFMNDGYYYDTERYPTADGTKYSYVQMNAVTLNSFEELAKKVAELNVEGGELYFRMDDSSTVADVLYVLESIMNRIDSTGTRYCTYNHYDTQSAEPVYRILVEVYEEEWGYEEEYGDLTVDKNEISDLLDKHIGVQKYNPNY